MAALLSGVAAGCGRDAEPEPGDRVPRLVLLFAPCSVTKSYLAPYDAGVTYTPHLAEFAREARVFDGHQTESGKSGIAYASIFAGVQAPRHGVYAHPKALDDSLYLVSEAFADAGYDSFFWGGHGMASAALNYAQGVPPGHSFSQGLVADDPVFRQILSRLRDDPEHRVFIAIPARPRTPREKTVELLRSLGYLE